MGQLDVHIRHGGGGPDLSGLIIPAVIVGVVVAVVMVVMQFIVWILAFLGAVFLVGAGLLTWWLCTQPARKARWAEAYRQAFAAREEADRQQVMQRQAFALELARASAPVINNIIDPAQLAAAVAGAQLLRDPARVVRGEVER